MKSFVVLLTLFIGTVFAAMPQWMYRIPKNGVNVYVGYGMGKSSKEARLAAFEDIASQISVHVKSSLQMQIRLSNDEMQKTSENKVSQETEAILNDYKILRSEYVDGNYYIALAYENIPALDKFVHKVKRGGTPEKVQAKNYLHYTLAGKELKEAFGKDIDFYLLRKGRKWFVGYDTVLQVLDKRNFSKFFATVSNDALQVSTNKKDNILHDGDKFFFRVRSDKEGFVSILTVYEDGTVSSLMRNVPVEANKIENIPDAEFETVPEAGLMQKGVETYDLYVVIYSAKKLRFDRFAYADERLINEEKYKNFDQLLEFIHDKTYATLKVVTKPKRF